jgi:tRNA (guanine37-N1)-methyltransferase
LIQFHFITLFPETIEVWLGTSIPGRARKAGLFDYTVVQLRDFAHNTHRTVDDVAYGGGGGMVLKVEPLAEAVETLWEKLGRENCRTVYFSPAGRRLNQKTLDELHPRHSGAGHLILICGHYEGVDQRFIDGWVDEEISLGDFVLTGGELPALCLADALIRQQDGVLGYEAAPLDESFRLKDPGSDAPLLEYPQYTRPADFRGQKVPEILLSGNHEKVRQWRLEASRERTKSRRPDLLPR